MADNSRFADLFNYKLYDGEQVILPEDLQERDSTEVLSILGLDEKEVQAKKWRDLLKAAVIKSTEKAFYVLLGVENQTEINYAMPVRNMLYDALNYERQVKEATKRHKKQNDKWSSAEFLSGFKMEDKLTPIIPDYHINLVVPSEIEDFDKFRTELGQTLEFIKYSKDDKKLDAMLSNLKNRKLTNETVSTINLFTGSNIKLNEEGEVTDVCLAIEILKQKAAATEFINSVENVMRNFSLSLEETCKILKHSVEDYENAKKLLEGAKNS